MCLQICTYITAESINLGAHWGWVVCVCVWTWYAERERNQITLCVWPRHTQHNALPSKDVDGDGIGIHFIVRSIFMA